MIKLQKSNFVLTNITGKEYDKNQGISSITWSRVA